MTRSMSPPFSQASISPAEATADVLKPIGVEKIDQDPRYLGVVLDKKDIG